jgi:hypothetical protein
MLPCGCVICDECRAATALHSSVADRPNLASIDADLRNVLDAWSRLPNSIRRAILALVEAAAPAD